MNKYSFKKYQPLGLRLWHWLNAVVILSLLLTVLLRKTLLSWRTNSALIEQKITDAGSVITADLAKEIAIAIRNPLWDWHIYLGYTLAFLLVVRILVAVLIEKKIFEISHFKNIFNINRFAPSDKKQAMHYSLVKIGYVVFYLMTLVMVLTGLLLAFEGNLNLSESISEFFEETHELSMWFFVVFIGVHLGGVLWAENTTEKGIVSDMINGGKK